ncbi:MAG: PorP/SprF family type IX secretion system membrane protein [Bacteroidia bacterium]
MKKIISILFIIFSLPFGEGRGGVYAQQLGMYSHYFYKPMLYNPAFAGYDNTTNALLLHRNQWTDFKGAPRLTIFTMDGSLIDNKVGIGMCLTSDRKGITNRTTGNLSYSYGISLNDDTRILFGLSLGVVYQSLDFSRTQVENNADPNLFSDLQRKTAFDGNAGVAFVWKGLEAGIAVPQIMQNKISYQDYTNVRGYYTMARHYMASVKYKISVAEEKGISIAPQGFVRFVPGAPLQYDGVLTFDWKDKFWLGATYKSGYAVSGNAGFYVHKQLSVGYSYDIVIGSIGSYSGMAHEVMINFKFAQNKHSHADTAASIDITNKNYEEMIAGLQTEVDSTEKILKELEARINSRSQNTDPEKNLTLTDLVVQGLIKRIEEMFDNKDATSEQIQSLRDEVSAFLDSEFSDVSTQKMMKKQYEQLNRSQEITSVLVKGTIILPKIQAEKNYSAITISVTDKETNGLVGTYLPNSKTGKYLFILTPGRNYIIKAEGQGYEPYSEDFSPINSKESYELGHEIRMKEAQ